MVLFLLFLSFYTLDFIIHIIALILESTKCNGKNICLSILLNKKKNQSLNLPSTKNLLWWSEIRPGLH